MYIYKMCLPMHNLLNVKLHLTYNSFLYQVNVKINASVFIIITVLRQLSCNLQ